MIKRDRILTHIIAILLGAFIANTSWVQKHSENAISFVRTAKMVFMADNFKEADLAHTFAVMGQHYYLEESSYEKMFKFAKSGEQYLLVSKFTSNEALQKSAIVKAVQMVDWTSYWTSRSTVCANMQHGKKIDNACDRTDLRMDILHVSQGITPNIFDEIIDEILKSIDPVSLGNFANIYYAYDDDQENAVMQKKIEQRILAIPATSSTLQVWADVRSTKPIEEIVAGKMAEVATSSTELLAMSNHLHYEDAVDILDMAIANKCKSFDDCLLVVQEYPPLSSPCLAASIRLQSFIKTEKMRKGILKYLKARLKNEGLGLKMSDGYRRENVRATADQAYVSKVGKGLNISEGETSLQRSRRLRNLAHQKAVNMHNPNAVPDLSGKPGYLTFALDDDCVKKNGGQRDKCFREILISHGKIVSWGKQVTIPITK